jgi:hypothetical protein
MSLRPRASKTASKLLRRGLPFLGTIFWGRETDKNRKQRESGRLPYNQKDFIHAMVCPLRLLLRWGVLRQRTSALDRWIVWSAIIDSFRVTAIQRLVVAFVKRGLGIGQPCFCLSLARTSRSLRSQKRVKRRCLFCRIRHYGLAVRPCSHSYSQANSPVTTPVAACRFRPVGEFASPVHHCALRALISGQKRLTAFASSRSGHLPKTRFAMTRPLYKKGGTL